MEDSRCPKCWEAVHYGHIDEHIEKCCNNLKYGIVVIMTDEYLSSIFSKELLDSFILKGEEVMSKAMFYIALAKLSVPFEMADEIKTELRRDIFSDSFFLKLRSSSFFPGSHTISENGIYPRILFNKEG